MLRQFAVIVFSLTLCVPLNAKSDHRDAPQTARQALLEMFFSTQPGTLVKHLPAVTRAALEQSGALASLQQYSTLAAQFQTQDKKLETFATGPVLLTSEDSKTGQKFEVVIENDSLRGDQDDIEVSFHTSKDSQAEKTPFMPRVVFSMKMESEVWTLHDIAITINLPLADPDLWKRISDGMKARAASIANSQIQAPGTALARQVSSNPSGDSGALAAMREIVAAETAYAATYPAVGYTCTLSDLDGFGAAEADEHHAMLIRSGLAGGKHQGYSFSLSGCAGAPAASFQLTATPLGTSFGRRAFCANQSRTIHSSADSDAAACLRNGTVIP
ncbi:MAG: hypothetical protein WAM89_20095 [Terriglobales bacterium]